MKIVVAFMVLLSVVAASANVTEKLTIHQPTQIAASPKAPPPPKAPEVPPKPPVIPPKKGK